MEIGSDRIGTKERDGKGLTITKDKGSSEDPSVGRRSEEKRRYILTSFPFEGTPSNTIKSKSIKETMDVVGSKHTFDG